jgi:hypothetical protein
VNAIHPPKAPLVFRVGVTGHRPDPDRGRPQPDVARLRLTIRAILQHIADAVDGVAQAHGEMFDRAGGSGPSPCGGTLRLISALAEGPDQWIADEAVKIGYELQCPLPFAREEYEHDFTDRTVKDEFARLLGKATAVLELDGQVDVGEDGARKPSSAAYEAAGRAVLNQTDLLLAVWDGKPPQGRGGTGAVVVEALQRGIPVVWVIWSSPEKWLLRLPEWRLVQRPADIEGDADRLKVQVQELLLPPEEADRAEHRRATTDRVHFFGETQKHGNPILGCWQVFLWVVTGEIFTSKRLNELRSAAPFRVESFEDGTRADWLDKCQGTLLDPERPHEAAPQLAAKIEYGYLRHYAWANLLSVYYASLYRSAFLVSYLLAAAAVAFALFPTAAGLNHRPGVVFTASELLAIVAILGLTWYGRHQHWHERWIDYRMLAERLRLARCLALLGGGGQPAALAAHLATFGNPAATWMHWHYRAIERAAGLPSIRLTGEYLKAAREFWLTNLIEDQIKYHRATGHRYKRLDETLHIAGSGLFAATFVACGLHLLTSRPFSAEWLIFYAAFFPALSAALSAIRTQAEALRLARRSHAMEKSLDQIKLDLASVPIRGQEGHSQRLRLAADRVTDLMVREMLDWRVVLLDRPLETHI